MFNTQPALPQLFSKKGARAQALIMTKGTFAIQQQSNSKNKFKFKNDICQKMQKS